jgi:dipeptidyl aminopeptidase/acylaminoacyl peptidase
MEPRSWGSIVDPCFSILWYPSALPAENPMRNLSLAAALFLMLSLLGVSQTARHAFGFDDAASLRSAAAVAVSPDGKNVLYRVQFGGHKGPTNTEWNLIPAGGGDSRHLNLPEKFKPTGFTRYGTALYGLSEVDKIPQLATLPLAPPNTPAAAAATPVALTGLPRGIHSAQISPDGSRYAVLADPRLPDPLSDVHTVIEAKPISVYVVNADGTNGSWWCPVLHDVNAVAWSHDGSSIAVVSSTPKIGFHYLRSFIDVCGAGGAKHVATIENAVGEIGWINSDKDLAFLSTTTPVLTPDHVWTVAAAGGTAIDRTPKLEASALGLSVDTQGNAWILVAHGVRSEVDSFQNNSLATAYIWPDGTINGPPLSPEIASSADTHVFTVADPRHASNLAIPRGNSLERLTTEGDEQLAKTWLGEVRAARWTSKEGVRLEGIVTFPPDFKSGQRYPFMVLPHGGPEANDSLRRDAFCRFFAGMGYVLLQPEYRGSTGYGSEFLAAIYQHFGDRAYRDVDSATDYAVDQGWANPDRLTMFGWSAGGFLTSWTVTQTHRYKAAIEGAGITDWLTFMWTSDVQQIDYDARWPDKDSRAFTDFSAAMHSENVSTPLLILHGAADESVPTYQGREYFEVLAAREKTARMVTYPGSPHVPTLWEQRQDVFREIAAWLARYNPGK